MGNVLVIAVHPDDETLGCGATLLRHRAQHQDIYWLICTAMSEQSGATKAQIADRERVISQVAGQYQFKKVFQLGLASTRVDVCPSHLLISQISAIINEVQPHTLYLPFKSDIHSDHRKIFEAAYSCTKSFRYPSIKKILMMETLSETEFAPATKEDCFVPNVFVDISDYFEQKCAILNLYESEMGQHPFPRSIRNVTALATLRGASAGCDYAESFMLLKEILP